MSQLTDIAPNPHILQFIGWLSADIPELHHVEVPLLAESYKRFREALPPTDAQSMADAAEMLWVVLANVSGGDWTKQTPEWQEAAARWRDNYFASVKAGR